MATPKRTLHHAWRISGLIKTWQLLLVCLVLAACSIYFLRQNYATMVSLRNDLYQADEEAKSPEEVEAKLQALRNHVTGHMNTNLRAGNLSIKEPPIQLKGLYDRAHAAEKARVSQANESLYTEAQAECEKRFPVGLSGSGRIPCIEQYVNERGVKERPIAREFYMFDFVSPSWSPDAAGICLLLAGALFIITALKFLTERLILAYLKSRHE